MMSKGKAARNFLPALMSAAVTQQEGLLAPVAPLSFFILCRYVTHLAWARPYETLSCSVTGLAGVVVLFIQYRLDCTFKLG